MHSSDTDCEDIFMPISCDEPPHIFPRHHYHPVRRTGLSQSTPIQTNKFYANLFLGSRTEGVWCQPYRLFHTNVQTHDQSFGMAVSHTERLDRVYGPDPNAERIDWYYNNRAPAHFIFSSRELSHGDSTMFLEKAAAGSVVVHLRAPGYSEACDLVFPLVQGMGFVTALYSSSTPLFKSAIGFRSVTPVSLSSARHGLQKFRIEFNDATIWLLYALPTHNDDKLSLSLQRPHHCEAAHPFSGTVQLAKCPSPACEDVYDDCAGAYAVDVRYAGSLKGATGQYSFHFKRGDRLAVPLLMFALPHHVASFSAQTLEGLQRFFQLQTTTKGPSTAVLCNSSWTMVEDRAPVHLASSHLCDASPNIDGDRREKILDAAMAEIEQDMDTATNQESTYFSGKAMNKYAQLCQVLSKYADKRITSTALDKWQAAWARFSSNRQRTPLVYESSWKGVVSSGAYETGDPGGDFGATYYNDHHFHYSYFIHAAAIIASIYTQHGDNSWLEENRAFVESLIRDAGNPSTQDPYFPVSRAFDWYNGHSWAKGLFESVDGKDEESTSEDVHFAYAAQLWGFVTGATALAARSTVMLAILRRALSSYFYIRSDNPNHPAQFAQNRVAGITFEQKVAHTTWFGDNIEFIHGMHMMPATPATAYIRDAEWCKEEWATWFSDGRVDSIEGGWRGVLYASMIAWDPTTAARWFFADNFDMKHLDGCMSLAYYRALAADAEKVFRRG